MGRAALNEPARAEAEASKQPGAVSTGFCINWNCLGYGILRSQTSGEVFIYKEDLRNCDQLIVGDVVTFEMGGGDFFFKNQKPKALNCFKTGGSQGYSPGFQTGGYNPQVVGIPGLAPPPPPPPPINDMSAFASPYVPIPAGVAPSRPAQPSGSSGSADVGYLLKHAAAASALKLLGNSSTPKARSRSRSASSSSSSRRGRKRSRSRKRSS